MSSSRPVVLVTGAARRIGAAIVRRLASEGWAVAIHCHRSVADAQQLLSELQSNGVDACMVSANLASLDETASMFGQVRTVLGPVTAVVNNASQFEFDRGSAVDWSLWQSHLDTNLRAPVQLAQLLHAQDTGEVSSRCVVNILDQKVFNLNPDFFSYTVSKLALEGATRMLALELAPTTRVCAVAPGLTMMSGDQSSSNFEKAHQVTPLGHSSDALDIAEAVAYLLRAKSVTGTTLVVDGGQNLFPLQRDVMFEVDDNV